MNSHLLLGGRYELRAVLGRGGMAVVHLARDTHLERWVAVKVLRAERARDPQVRSRLRREAQAIASLNHPGIVSIHDIGHEQVEGIAPGDPGVPFIVMEHVAGQSLRLRLRGGALDVDEAVQHQLGVLAALAYSHRAGIVHRDIKPANIMVTLDGGIKVVDFGIAHIGGAGDATTTLTRSLLGTAKYLSPEQVRGEPLDARSDLYSAGCLLYELLTARPPFIGETPLAFAYQHVHRNPDRASAYRAEVTPALDAVLMTALAKDRNDRFQSARAFTEALESAVRSPNRANERDDRHTMAHVAPFHPARRTATVASQSLAQ